MNEYPVADQQGRAPQLQGDVVGGRVKLGRWRAWAVALLAVAASIALAVGWNSPVRAGLTLVFLLFGPGLAIAELLEIRDGVQQLALAAGVSLAVDTIVSVALLYAGLPSAGLAFAVIVAITGLALIVGALRAPRAPEVTAGHPEPAAP